MVQSRADAAQKSLDWRMNMEYTQILKRAYEIARDYRALWLFGFLLALTSGAGSSAGSGNNGIRFDARDFRRGPDFDFRGFPDFRFDAPSMEAIWSLAIVLICFIVLLTVAAGIARYVAENAIVRMVNDYEESGVKISARQGLKLGWSRTALRLFLIDLLVGLAFALVVILLLLLAAAPLLAFLTDVVALRAAGGVMAAGLGILFGFILVVAGILLAQVMNLVRRACILEDLGVMDALRRGFALARGRPGDVLIMALILFGIAIGYMLLMLPVFVLILVVAGVLSGLPALLVGGLFSLFSQGTLPWIAAGVVGIPLFFLVMILSGGFLGGLLATFDSSAWTLLYRELLALEKGGKNTLHGHLPAADVSVEA
jgi:hypothetical protein